MDEAASMPEALIVYYSLHGTTRRVAQAIGQGLTDGGYRVKLWDMLGENEPPDMTAYPLIGIGSPVYYYQLPLPVVDYVKSLPALQNARIFSFLLYGTYAFDAAGLISRGIQSSEASFAGHFQCRGADIYQGYLQAGYLFSPGSPTEPELAEARAFGLALTQTGSGSEYIEGPLAKPGPVYLIERFISHRWFMRHIYSRTFKANDKCRSCGTCRRVCPVHNIKVEKARPPGWGRNCLGCLNCQLKCPETAISSFVDWPLTQLLIKHNIRAALNDSSIQYEDYPDQSQPDPN